MARSTWEYKLNERLVLREEMTPQLRIVSDWLCDLMARREYKTFSQVSQYFIRCAMQCLPPEVSGDFKSPTISILGSWFRGESAVRNDWLDSIAYVRRCEEGLPETFTGTDVMRWIRSAREAEPEPKPIEPQLELTGSAIVEQIAGQIEQLALKDAVAVMGATLAHIERLTGANGVQNDVQHKKVKK